MHHYRRSALRSETRRDSAINLIQTDKSRGGTRVTDRAVCSSYRNSGLNNGVIETGSPFGHAETGEKQFKILAGMQRIGL